MTDQSPSLNDAFDEAVLIAGGQSALARMLQVSQQRVNNWRKSGVPIEFCAAIERITHGAVNRRALRPDDFARIWPELADTTATHLVRAVRSSMDTQVAAQKA